MSALDRLRAAISAIGESARGVSHHFRGRARAVERADVVLSTAITRQLVEAKAELEEFVGTTRWAWEDEA